MDLTRELSTAIRIAKDASRMILDHYDGDIVTEEKLGVDDHYEPVTEADRAASRLIVAELEKEFPADGILSEEESDVIERRLSKNRVWIIDPIDGTAGFVKRDGDFAVQIGLAIDGEPVVGVVLLPFHKILYYALKGSGAYSESNGEIKKLRVNDTTDFSGMLMAVSRNHRSPKINSILKEFGIRGEVQRGSVGLKIGLIAEQTCDLYIHLSPRTKLWDTCAPQIILEEAGGRLTDLFGEAIHYNISDVQNYGGIVATNGAVHDKTIRRLRPLLNEFGRLRLRGKANRG
ncbi:3'(2'),5'-bisphosphate nucleotidase CysQ [Leptolyngbya sp. 7M]|uniref:3'(2'),5'-bisphosphate nucleotidase CysQ family protein n=1 Tax=Leptolyngbya sp. 7M TaxID=2812896 RepID=UPI001CED5D0E|nr:3'(2'),5'-bisphosphate nucleotidase CysQ [Leptolyngbya sp. 7M]